MDANAASRSAEATTAKGASVSAGTAATATSAGAKLLVAGLILSLCGVGIAFGLVVSFRENDSGGTSVVETDDDNSNNSSPAKGGIKANTCAVDQVLQSVPRADGDGVAVVCVPAAQVCHEWQQAVKEECISCPDGFVTGTDASTGELNYEVCEPCPPGQVRSSVHGPADGPCVDADLFCEPWQIAVDGKCVDCDVGQESGGSGGAPTYLSCEYCPPGMVRSSSDGAALGPCVGAESFCSPWQTAVDGKCTDCPKGLVSSVDENGMPTYEGCEPCPDGTVRQDRNDGEEIGDACISAKGSCELFERASRGRCVPCPEGAFSSVDADGKTYNHKSCEFCPIGQVRSDANGSGEGPCVSAVGYCNMWQWAFEGRCVDCDRGQVSMIDSATDWPTHMGCNFCPRGQVRTDPSGRRAGPCISAAGVCGMNQRAIKGQCINCLDGEVTSRNPDGTPNHLACGSP